ncbi:MAG: ATP synthase F1 subunit delta [Leptolyngbya sp.]|nr:ATP synthase F1 subunit delta [Leptolyngbya sp.]
MKDGTTTSEVALPYAKALMAIAQDNGVVDAIGDEVSSLLELLRSSDELSQFLGNPLIDPEAKKGALGRLTEGQVNPAVTTVLLLLVDRNRIMYLEDVLEQYQVLLREIKQTVLADVVSAVPLSEEQTSTIRERVAALSGAQNVELSVQVDPDLLGGLIVKVGSQVIDASLRGQLRRIGMQLATAA